MTSNDSEFEVKAADIIGLYLNPPQHAAVFCVDEKTAIQALDRRDPALPLSPGRAERHGREDRKGGGENGAAAHQRRIRGIFDGVGRKAKWAKEIHIVLDNLSAHKTQVVEQFPAEHPKVRFHFTPTYSSWLNQVEIWFANIERDVIARGVFTWVSDLRRKLMKYIRAFG
jgi:transposase